jgi:hypothetical protein
VPTTVLHWRVWARRLAPTTRGMTFALSTLTCTVKRDWCVARPHCRMSVTMRKASLPRGKEAPHLSHSGQQQGESPTLQLSC